MALMLGKLNDALLSAGASKDQAREAAEEVAAYDNRLTSLEGKVDRLVWMGGTNMVLTLIVLGKVLIP